VGDLITLSDLPPAAQRASKLDPHKTKWILVDHNALQGELGNVYSGRVVGAIDHHDEENQVPKDSRDEPRIITKSGSCTSLVVEYCREAWDALSTKPSTDETAIWDKELAHLALAPILIDTTNLKDSSKVTPTDIKAVEYLESKLNASSAKYSRDDYFSQISTAKTAIDDLSINDILRKDYKQWTDTGSGSVNLGISSVVKPLDFLLKKADSKSSLLASLSGFAADRKLSLYAIMTAYTSTTSPSESGEFKRELLLLLLHDSIGAEAARAFESNAAEILGLKPWGTGELDCDLLGMGQGEGQGEGGGGQHEDEDEDEDEEGHGHGKRQGWGSRCWVQERVENSRKQVGPLLRKAVHDTAHRKQT
jgi:exopolyphosphatase